jgi:hypothetical protein
MTTSTDSLSDTDRVVAELRRTWDGNIKVQKRLRAQMELSERLLAVLESKDREPDVETVMRALRAALAEVPSL